MSLKNNKFLRRMAVAVMTGAMMVSMLGMTAFAETSAITSVDLVKKVTTDGDTYAPNTSFTFTVAKADKGDYDGNVVYEGIEGGLVMGKSTLEFAPSGDAPAAEYSETGKIAVNASVFTAPGVYHYTVTETAGSYEGIVYDTTVRDVYVYVVNGTSGLEVKHVIVTKDVDDETTGETKKVKQSGLEFINDYGADENNDSTHDVIITKVVAGDQGDKNKDFSFEVSVAGGSGEWYKVVKTEKSGTTTEGIIVSGANATKYTLKDGESIRIYGLSESDTYTVTEEKYEADGYETTVKIGEDDAVTTNTATGKLTADATAVTVTNTKNAVTPTGIILNIAPYILMVAVAGVLAFLFLRKRNVREF